MEFNLKNERFSKKETSLMVLLEKKLLNMDESMEALKRLYGFDFEEKSTSDLRSLLSDSHNTPVSEYQSLIDFLYKLACAYSDLEFIKKQQNIAEKALILIEYINEDTRSYSYANHIIAEKLKAICDSPEESNS